MVYFLKDVKMCGLGENVQLEIPFHAPLLGQGPKYPSSSPSSDTARSKLEMSLWPVLSTSHVKTFFITLSLIFAVLWRVSGFKGFSSPHRFFPANSLMYRSLRFITSAYFPSTTVRTASILDPNETNRFNEIGNV